MSIEFFDLPEKWEWVTCQSVIDVRDGTHDTPKYQPTGIPLVTSKNLSNGDIDFENVSYISEEDHQLISKRSKVDEGDILLAMIGTIGNPVIVKTDTEFSIKNIALFKFGESEVDAKYFRYLLDTDIIKMQLLAATRGGTQQFVSLKVLRNLQIPLPPLGEQQRIAAILDKADALRAKRRAALTKLDTLLQSTFLHMFGDPVTNPMGWPVMELGDVIDFRTGKLDSNAAVDGGDYPFFTCAREVFQIDHYAFDEEVLLMAGNNASADYWVKHHKGKFNAYQRTYVMTLRLPHLSYKYMRLAMEYKLAELKRISKGTNTRYLTLGLLKPLRVQIPSSNVLGQFDIVHDRLVAKQKRMEDSLTYFDNLFHSLQQRAFKGEL